jgi:hypothetical protein
MDPLVGLGAKISVLPGELLRLATPELPSFT